MCARPDAWLTSVPDAEPQESNSGPLRLFSCFLEGLLASLVLPKGKHTLNVSEEKPGWLLGSAWPARPLAHVSPMGSPRAALLLPQRGTSRAPARICFLGTARKYPRGQGRRQKGFASGLPWLGVNKPQRRTINHPPARACVPRMCSAPVFRTCRPRAPCLLAAPAACGVGPLPGLEAFRDRDTAPLSPSVVPFSFLLPPGAWARGELLGPLPHPPPQSRLINEFRRAWRFIRVITRRPAGPLLHLEARVRLISSLAAHYHPGLLP